MSNLEWVCFLTKKWLELIWVSNSEFVIFYFFKNLKNLENVLQKSLWQSFENEKLEMAILFFFPCSLSWCTLFFLLIHFSWRKSQNKIACFDSKFVIFYFFKKLKISENDLQKSLWQSFKNYKMEMAILFFHALCCEVLCFFCWCIFHGENCKTKLPVLTFLKKAENGQFCFVIFSIKNASTEKTKYTTTKSTEKTKKMAVSIVFVDTLKVV